MWLEGSEFRVQGLFTRAKVSILDSVCALTLPGIHRGPNTLLSDSVLHIPIGSM